MDLDASPHGKVFNDPIHGHIELHPLCVKIVDTPYFQRLRNIKQIGTCYLVYPGASHNRFEHSLGVCHLAGKLLTAIKERQAELLDEKDILCVQVAGLCHDLGQGPFSRLFEKKFIPSRHQNWKVEDISVKMFEHMLSVNGGSLRRDFEDLMDDFDEEVDIKFIKNMISAPKINRSVEWQDDVMGRGKEKAFLYEVVSNKNTGIDVDRWDYLARDSYMLGMKNIFDLNRCISVARVLEVEGGMTQICFRDKEAQDIYDMFYTRMTLHRRAYQHKTTNIISGMVCDALLAASDHLMFEGMDGKELSLTKIIDDMDMEAFSKVTDDVFHTILQSNDRKLKSSKEILNHVVTRNLYKCVGQTQIKDDQDRPFDESSFKEALHRKIMTKQSGSEENYTKIDVVKLNYGMEDKDPIKNVRFYSKFQKDVPITLNKDQVSYVLPDTFSEQIVRVYCRSSSDEQIKVVRDSFAEWCEENGYPRPKDKRGEPILNGQ